MPSILQVETTASAPSARSTLLAAALRYVAELNGPRMILYCYLIWWLFTVARYFDPSPSLWLSSLGIAAIIGTALYLSTAHAGRSKSTLDRWQVFRFYLMPFCVSSFAALIKDRGFVLVFHPSLAANLEAIGYCAAFVAFIALAKRVVPSPSAPAAD